MQSTLSLLRAIPWLILAGCCHFALVLYLGLIRYPFLQTKNQHFSFFSSFCISAGIQCALVVLLASFVIPTEVFTPYQEQLVIERTRELESPVLTSIDDSAAESLDVGEIEILGATVGGEAMATMDVELAEIEIQVPESGADTFSLPGEGLGQILGSGVSSGVGRGTDFFGITAGGNAFVFVVDVSGSMEGKRFRRARAELKKTLEKLSEGQQFYIIFYNHNTLPMPTSGMIAASTENVSQTNKWISKVKCSGDTDPEPGLRMAMRLGPDAVFLLSDGEFDRLIAVRISEVWNEFAVPVHTISFTTRDGEPVMKAISSMTGGTYRFVR